MEHCPKLVNNHGMLATTAWKMSKYGVFSGPYFPMFGPEKTPDLVTFHAVYSHR